MLTVLGGLAEFERELIRARTSEGRTRALANGVKLGRKPNWLWAAVNISAPFIEAGYAVASDALSRALVPDFQTTHARLAGFAVEPYRTIMRPRRSSKAARANAIA
jgi:DNA invertase Pin-like site-specific DNA recombinase